eukprot:scaffold22425_cov19-Tisochrysis_lutea.AAC.1
MAGMQLFCSHLMCLACLHAFFLTTIRLHGGAVWERSAKDLKGSALMVLLGVAMPQTDSRDGTAKLNANHQRIAIICGELHRLRCNPCSGFLALFVTTPTERLDVAKRKMPACLPGKRAEAKQQQQQQQQQQKQGQELLPCALHWPDCNAFKKCTASIW